jgi:hypothetical protein
VLLWLGCAQKSCLWLASDESMIQPVAQELIIVWGKRRSRCSDYRLPPAAYCIPLP